MTRPMSEPDQSTARKGWHRAALLFAAGAMLLVLLAVALLSFDTPLTQVRDPETDDAYVGGDTVPIAARVQGYLVALPITDNQPVRAGDALGQIEQSDYRAQLEQAQAALEAARAQVGTLDAQRGQLLAQIGQAQTQQASQQADTVRTSPELVRQEKLINTDVGVRRTLEQAQADQRRTEAGVEQARATVGVRQKQLDTLTAQRDEAQAAVLARQADVRLAEINLGWTLITAPADGTLAARRVRVGDLMQPGTALTSLTPLDTVWVDANFTERQIPRIRIGQLARLVVDAFPNSPLDGHVIGMAPLTGGQLSPIPPDNTTGNFTKVVQRVPVRIAIDWHGSPLIGRVRPGMSAVVAERAALQASEAAVLLAAATAYLDVARDERIVLLDRNQTAVLERTLRATQQELAAGAVTETDVAQSVARLADQRANQAQAEGELAASRASFQQEVGELPGDLALPTLALPLPADRRATLALVPGSNFDIQQARSALAASRQGIDIARAGLLPKLSLELRGSRLRDTDVQALHERDNIAEGTLQFTVPLYQGGGPAAETRQAKEAESRSLLQIDVVLRQAQRQAQTAWDMLEAGRTRVAQARISIDANTVATRGVARQQSVGARTLLDVLNAQQELLNAEVNLARATRDEDVAELQLLAVTGRLTAEQIGLHVPVYDPVRHYDATRDRWGGLTPAP
jgi:membrane fusion protein (multidrug efflux system)